MRMRGTRKIGEWPAWIDDVWEAGSVNAERTVEQDVAIPDELDLAYMAWTIIANVSEGNWEKQLPEWQDAAARWRDDFHAALAEHRAKS